MSEEENSKRKSNLCDLFDQALECDESDLREKLPQLDEERYGDEIFLAEGAQKQVYRVFDKVTCRQVALAKLKPGLDFTADENFVREAQLTALLEHPNIITVHDLGRCEDGRPAMLMELKQGGTLGAFLLKSDLRQRLRVFLALCDAMAYAHSQSIIHLDLKPDNIQVGNFGEVVVCDWGLAAWIQQQKQGESALAALSFSQKGTPGFMAPEQLSSDLKLDQRTDIYALGAILYCLLCGQAPLEGEQEQVLTATREGQIPFPSQRFPEQQFPLALEAVCRQAMALQMEDRYDSVQQLACEVDFFLKGYATSAEEAGAWQLFKLFYRRNQLLCRLTALFVLVIISLTVLFVRQQQQNLIAEENQRRLAEKASERAAEAMELYRQEKQALQAQHSKWSLDVLTGTDELRYQFFFSNPVHFVELTLQRLHKAIKLDKENRRAIALVGHQYFIQQRFVEANRWFSKSNYTQDDLVIVSKYFAELKNDDEQPLTLLQLEILLKQVGNDHRRRHSLCERLVAWHYHLHGHTQSGTYAPAVQQLLRIWNKGNSSIELYYDKQKRSLRLRGKKLKKLVATSQAGSQLSLLRFLDFTSLDLRGTSVYSLEGLRGLAQLNKLDLRKSLISDLSLLHELTHIRQITISPGQFTPQQLKGLPAHLKLIKK